MQHWLTNQPPSERMNIWINESRNQWINESINQWRTVDSVNQYSINQRSDDSVNQWSNGPMNQSNDDWVKQLLMSRWINEPMYQWRGDSVNQWISEPMNQGMDEWMEWARYFSLLSYFFTERPLRWGTSSRSYFFSEQHWAATYLGYFWSELPPNYLFSTFCIPIFLFAQLWQRV